MSTHNLCFEQKHKNYQGFLSENFQFLEVKFSIFLNRHVFVMFNSIFPSLIIAPGNRGSQVMFFISS